MGLFQRLKSGPKAEKAFNDALGIYQSFRQFPEHSVRYRHELSRVVSLCQEAIALNERHGDAHVLLANTYYLMYVDGFPAPGDPLPLQLAASVIQHWADEPMRQYPWTKNRDNGESIHATVARALSAPSSSHTERGTSGMRSLVQTHYTTAISRTSFPPT